MIQEEIIFVGKLVSREQAPDLVLEDEEYVIELTHVPIEDKTGAMGLKHLAGNYVHGTGHILGGVIIVSAIEKTEPERMSDPLRSYFNQLDIAAQSVVDLAQTDRGLKMLQRALNTDHSGDLVASDALDAEEDKKEPEKKISAWKRFSRSLWGKLAAAAMILYFLWHFIAPRLI